jgi:alpha-beta hydrolase superfamily lysophospholipase
MRVLTRRVAVAGLAASACAPVVQRPAVPPAGFTGPRLDADAFIAADGTRLPMDVWAAEGEPWAVIVALHGMNDYAHAFSDSGPWWASQGITTYAWDQRGFGRGPGRGVWGGVELMTRDLKTICALVRARHPRAVVAVVGHSMGGAVAIAAFASDTPPDADRLILAAPAVWGWSRQAIVNRIALWTTAHVYPGLKLVAPSWLARRIRASDNIEVLRAMGADRNMIFATRTDAVYGLVGLMQLADRSLSRVRAPLLYLYGQHDQIIPKAATFHAIKGLKPADRTAYYPDGWHLLTRDLEGPKVWADIAAYVKDAAAPLPSGTGPLPTGA